MARIPDLLKSPRPWWLNRAALVSLIGLALAAAYALALGFIIPSRVAEEFLDAQAAADQVHLEFLVSSGVIGAGEPDYTALNRFVQSAILRGDFVRVKLWSVDGTVLYSDAAELVGQTFTLDEDFHSMTETMSHIADLSADENYLEAEEFGGQLLETYVPIIDDDEVLAVWEIYRTLDAYEESVADTRRLVWASVGSGLVVLGLFLVSSFWMLIRTANSQKEAAEARSADLEWLLEVAKLTTSADDTDTLAERLEALFEGADEVRHASVTVKPTGGEAQVVVSTGELAPEEVRPHGVAVARSATSSGETEVVIVPSDIWGSPASVQALAEEVNVGFQKVLLTEGLNEYQAQLEAVMEKIVAVEESERRRLAGDLHDSLAQDLHRILFGIRKLAVGASPDVRDEIAELEGTVLDSSTSLRRLMSDLHPTVVEDVEFSAALRSLADRMVEEFGLTVSVDLAGCPEPPMEVKLAGYRIAQEALVNVAKHSGGDAAVLRTFEQDGDLVIEVEDQGGGLPADASPGRGIWLMRDRAAQLGGHVEFESTGDGLTVRTRIPIREAT